MAVHARQTKVGINLATSGSWGIGAAVATAVGAGDGHYVTGDLGVQLRMQMARMDAAGQNFIGSIQTANAEAINLAIPTYLHYADGFQNVLWALVLGTGGTAPAGSTTTQYVNTFEPATSKTGRYATIVRDKSQYISEVPGAKFTGFEVAVGDNGGMTITWNAIGNLEKSDSTINTATQISALTFPTLGLRAFFDDCVIRFNSQSGTTLATTDAMKFTGMRVRFNQPMDARHVAGQTSIIEPEENAFPETTIELDFARFDSTSDDFFAYHRDGTALKGDITFTGPLITGTYYYMMNFAFPNLVVTEYAAPVEGGADQVSPRIVLTALSTTTAASGMTGVLTPLRVTTTGISSANPFA